MKNLLQLVFLFIISFNLNGQCPAGTTEIIYENGASTPTGWTVEDQRTSAGGYWLLDGDPSTIVQSSNIDVSSYTEITINMQVATFGNGSTSNPANVEYSIDGGSTFTSIGVTNTPSNSSYISSGDLTVNIPAGNNDFQIRLSNSSTSEKGVRVKHLYICGSSSVPPCAVTLGTPAITCSSNTVGNGNDQVSISIPYIGSDNSITSVTAVDNNSNTITVGGNDPATEADGTITMTATEGQTIDLTINGGICDGTTVNVAIASDHCDPTNESIGGELTFQMIAPCGNDGDNEFVVFTNGDMPITIDDIALGSVNDANDSSWNYFWSTSVTGGNGPGVTENGNSTTTSASNDYGILDPIADASSYNTAANELNDMLTMDIFETPDPFTGDIPAYANVVFFIGYGDDGFDAADPSLDFSGQINNGPFYIILGDGNGTYGFFSNSNSRTQYITIGGTQSNVSYNPNNPIVLNGGGGGEYLNPDGLFYEDDSCIPSTSLTDDQAQPISLIDFKAVAKDSKVELIWVTATEENNSHFEIERSKNGIDFETIGKVKGAGNSTNKMDYNYMDDINILINNSHLYYRLKQVDFDGKYTYSKTQVVTTKSQGFVIYPNPAINGRDIHIQGRNIESINVYSLLGEKRLSESNVDSDHYTLSTQNLSKGVYIVRINGDTKHYKVVVQ